jgi:hypothetical protein
MLDRLRVKRTQVETDLSLLPSAPKSTKDVFSLCRGFERAFTLTVDVSMKEREREGGRRRDTRGDAAAII